MEQTYRKESIDSCFLVSPCYIQSQMSYKKLNLRRFRRLTLEKKVDFKKSAPSKVYNDLKYLSIDLDALWEQIKTPPGLSYKEYLRSAAWKAKKTILFRFFGHRCERCRAKGPEIQVHHVSYKRLFNETVEDLLIVCGPCHLIIHGSTNGKVFTHRPSKVLGILKST
jgi:hypothetical protein